MRLPFRQRFTLNTNPLFSSRRKDQGSGKNGKIQDETLGISANQYSNTVDFVQKDKIESQCEDQFYRQCRVPDL